VRHRSKYYGKEGWYLRLGTYYLRNKQRKYLFDNDLPGILCYISVGDRLVCVVKNDSIRYGTDVYLVLVQILFFWFFLIYSEIIRFFIKLSRLLRIDCKSSAIKSSLAIIGMSYTSSTAMGWIRTDWVFSAIDTITVVRRLSETARIISIHTHTPRPTRKHVCNIRIIPVSERIIHSFTGTHA